MREPVDEFEMRIPFPPRFRCWIGHFMHRPHDWFLVWADSLNYAIMMLDGTEDEVEMRSIRELEEAGFIPIRARPSNDDLGWLYSGKGGRQEAYLEDGEVGEWIIGHLEVPRLDVPDEPQTTFGFLYSPRKLEHQRREWERRREQRDAEGTEDEEGQDEE